jgi:hypothetical protein
MLTSHEILGFTTPALAMEILTFAFEADKPLYRTTLAAIAEARHVRPVFLERQPRAQRHAAMLATLTRPALEIAAASLLRTWLLKKHTAMLVDFLNALGIPHKDGVVEENLPETMDEAKLRTAVEGLLVKYPPEVVAIYLNAFTEMNEVEWPALKTMLETDKRIQLGG